MSRPHRELVTGVRSLLEDAVVTYRGTDHEDVLRDLLGRLEQPLRVAIAGRVKAGKSTLLNALLGEELAATDASECTRVVTWYVGGQDRRAWLYPRDADPVERPLRPGAGRVIDLGGFEADALRRIEVQVPTDALQRITVIDTPGIASVSVDVSARTQDFLAPERAADDRADVVLYLMRYLHAADVHFLEAFHDRTVLATAPVNAVGVLSRADEIGSGRPDAIDVARTIARRYRRDPRVRALVQTVVPVAGLLAQAAATLTDDDYAALRDVAGSAPDRLEHVLLSADRFASDTAPVPVSADRRTVLLHRLGIYGVRLSIGLMKASAVASRDELAGQLLQRSGLPDLRSVLLTQFAERGSIVKAYQALRTLEEVTSTAPRPGAQRLRQTADALMASAHEIEEMRVLNDLRTGEHSLPDDQRESMEALLGARGGSTRARLGLPDDAPTDETRRALRATLRQWQETAERPSTDVRMRRTAAVLRRTCEGLLMRPEMRRPSARPADPQRLRGGR